MKTFSLALVAGVAAAKEFCEYRCHWDPKGAWEEGWTQDHPCEERDTELSKNCFEMSEAEYAAKKAKEEIEKAMQDLERDFRHEVEKDWDWEMAKNMRDLQCMWAGFEPVTEGGCPDYKEFAMDYCKNKGDEFEWNDDWWQCMRKGSPDWNEWQERKSHNDKKALMKHHFNKIRAMVKYEVNIQGKDLEGIMQPAMELDQEGVRLAEEQGKELEAVFRNYEPKFEDWGKRAQEADEKAAQEAMDYFLTHIKLDGKELKEVLNSGDNAQAKVLMEGKAPEGINFTWEGPSMQELQGLVEEKVAPRVEELAKIGERIAQTGQQIGEQAARDMEDVHRNAERAYWNETRADRNEFDDKAESLMHDVGSWVKKQVQENVQVQKVALAKAAAEEEYNNNVATGLGAGVGGALAGCIVYHFLNKKQGVSAEQPLL